MKKQGQVRENLRKTNRKTNMQKTNRKEYERQLGRNTKKKEVKVRIIALVDVT